MFALFESSVNYDANRVSALSEHDEFLLACVDASASSYSGSGVFGNDHFHVGIELFENVFLDAILDVWRACEATTQDKTLDVLTFWMKCIGQSYLDFGHASTPSTIDLALE